jgi:hypothetical protein
VLIEMSTSYRQVVAWTEGKLRRVFDGEFLGVETPLASSLKEVSHWSEAYATLHLAVFRHALLSMPAAWSLSKIGVKIVIGHVKGAK